ncbi:MAG: polysaccharide deacetylase family protein [Anaerolineae bacterium]|nr:polysaccharide deacetylase family protein [Anaerolineae bacterium]
MTQSKLFLLRYDTEGQEGMHGFLDAVLRIHRKHAIPVTLFCTGAAIECREKEFRRFFQEIEDDPLFDIQDHSYSHIGLGYQRGPSIEALRADYERSFAVHERVLGRSPIGVTICGTSGRDGPRLQGFDETNKSRAEFEMMVGQLGLKMINTFLTGYDESREFASYAALGHPEVMGFPSAHSDTSWMYQREHGDPLEYVLALIDERAQKGEHLPVMLHDWVVWNHAPDQELSHVVRITDAARRQGYELVTHAACYEQRALWQL